MTRTVSILAAVCLALTLAAPARAVSIGHALRTPLPDVKLDSVSLNDAIEFLRDVSGANIVVNWKALEADGIDKDAPVTVRLRGVPLRRVLDVILSEAGGTTPLSYTYDSDVLEVTTKELADKKLYTRIYPVEDLLMEVPDFNDAPRFDLSQASQQGQGGGGGQSLFSGGGANSGAQPGQTRADRGAALVELIQSLIEPEIWQANGGIASIKFFQSSLIVTAPQSVHEALAGMTD